MQCSMLTSPARDALLRYVHRDTARSWRANPAAVVTITAHQLGPLRCGLRLQAAAPPPLRPLSFGAVLGSLQLQVRMLFLHAHVKLIHAVIWSLHAKSPDRTCAALRRMPAAAARCCGSPRMHPMARCDKAEMHQYMRPRSTAADGSATVAQKLRIMHAAPVKAEYRVSFQTGTGGKFYCASAGHQRTSGRPRRTRCGGEGVLRADGCG